MEGYEAEYEVVKYLLRVNPHPDGWLAQPYGPRSAAKYYDQYGFNNSWYNKWDKYGGRWKITYRGVGFDYYEFYLYAPNTVKFNSLSGLLLHQGERLCDSVIRKRSAADKIKSAGDGRDC
jgi:hypothetical protein